jgi:hypothetical protein
MAIELLIFVVVLVGLDLAALVFGADSRDGRDWRGNGGAR